MIVKKINQCMLMKNKTIIILTVILTIMVRLAVAQKIDISKPSENNVFMADPFVLKDGETYYLYGTRSAKRGIQVYRSKDLKIWEGPVGAKDGFALVKEDVYGDKHIMGAYIVKKEDQFYFYYVATDRPVIAVATGDSPLGPFTQKNEKPLNLKGKSIAPHIFTDDDGRSYMYYTKLQGGNKIYVAEMEDDLLTVKENTAKECIKVTEPWENTDKNPSHDWPVAEGAAVLKHKDTYYLFYTANHYLNPDYNVGYATASFPTGPWTKFEGNPIIKQNDEAVGIGSGEFIRNPAGELLFFYHAHHNLEKVSPRRVVYSKVEFVPNDNGGPDVVKMSDKYFPVRGRNGDR